MEKPLVWLSSNESLDMDSFASLFLLSGILELALDKKNRGWQVPKAHEALEPLLGLLEEAGAAAPLACYLPIRQAELLWRRDISTLLSFVLSEPSVAGPTSGNGLKTAEEGRQLCQKLAAESLALLLPKFYFFEEQASFQPQNANGRCASGELLCLVDRHSLSSLEGAWQQQLALIFDHRPDSGACQLAKLRRVEQRISCVCLLLEWAEELGLASATDGWAGLAWQLRLLALATMYLDFIQRQAGGGSAHGRALQQLPDLAMDKLEDRKIFSALWGGLLAEEDLQERLSPLGQSSEKALGRLLASLEEARHSQDSASLQQQICLDMKILEVPLGSQLSEGGKRTDECYLRIATAVLGLSCQDFAQRFAKEAPGLAEEVLSGHRAEILLILHKQGPKNAQRALSLCLENRLAAKGLEPVLIEKLASGLEGLTGFPCTRLSKSRNAASKYGAGEGLVQFLQKDQLQTRKAFTPAFLKLCRDVIQA